MKLGLSLGYAGDALSETKGLVALAEGLGFDSLWTAEAYGSDALSPLAFHAADTSTIRLGTAITQMSARTPTATAMAAMTLDQLSGGRVMMGLGASGPQVVEGWYGQPYERPLDRTREYFDIVRQVMRRDTVQLNGRHYSIPFPGSTGLGKPLRSTLHPVRSQIPLLLAAQGPKNVALAAEIADGWIPLFYTPHDDSAYRESLRTGFERRGGAPDGFEVASLAGVEFGEVEEAADRVRPLLALYIGGMGAKEANFHYEAFARQGFAAECARIQGAFLDGRRKDAIAAVSTEMVERVALVGPPAKVKDELQAWEESLVTTLITWGGPDKLTQLVDLLP